MPAAHISNQRDNKATEYRGRLAPSPTGFLHLGHAQTFRTAQQRAQDNNGILVLRTEDLDITRCTPEFSSAMLEDMRWFGLRWQEGSDIGGSFGPYLQSQRHSFYRASFERLLEDGYLFPCVCSRKEVQRSAQAPHPNDDEPVYPGTCRNRKCDSPSSIGSDSRQPSIEEAPSAQQESVRINWRFRVPDGETISFVDKRYGPQHFVAGKDFGDFVVWRHDNVPSYQLAVVVDDASMHITEVVRGVDLMRSTARQILLYRALKLEPPAFYHCPLVTDESGVRLAKRNDALSLRTLRETGAKPEQLCRTSGATEEAVRKIDPGV